MNRIPSSLTEVLLERGRFTRREGLQLPSRASRLHWSSAFRCSRISRLAALLTTGIKFLLPDGLPIGVSIDTISFHSGIRLNAAACRCWAIPSLIS